MLPNVLQPSPTDHVPVLTNEVRSSLDVQPGDTVVDATFGAGGHAAVLAAELRGRGKVIAIDRDPTARTYFERFAKRAGVQARLLRGDFGVVLPQLAENGVQADAILLDLGVSSMQLDRPERGFSYSVDAPLDMRMDTSQELSAGARARDDLSPLRRGAVLEADRPRDRATPQGAALRAHRRPRRHDQSGAPCARAVR
jgi:16S rRNA (cytosine(1402)-N(4))-methyltransferase